MYVILYTLTLSYNRANFTIGATPKAGIVAWHKERTRE